MQGNCDSSTGVCVCKPGFGGTACETSMLGYLCVHVGGLSLATDLRANMRFAAVLCPTSHSSNTPCNGHGRCLSMAEIASDVDDIATHVRCFSRTIYQFEIFRPTQEPIHFVYILR